MKSPDVSIILPSIRPENLIKFYESAQNACQRYSFEIIIPGPYLIPEELMKKGNVVFIHTYANPTICFQMAALLARGEFIYNTTDDGLLQPNVIDIAVDLHREALTFKDMINMRYDEGVLDPITLLPLKENHEHFSPYYWIAHSHADLRLPGIPVNYKLCMHFFIKKNYFLWLGGFDCNYEYSNHALHDLAFRVQSDGGQIVSLPVVAFYCSHLPGQQGDHGPVNDAQLGPDITRFNSIYGNSTLDIKQRINLNYDDWKNFPNIWERRFDKNNLLVNKI